MRQHVESAPLQVPMPQVARFVRQLSHDLRNYLNAAELQVAFMKEITHEPELKNEVQRLRQMLAEMASSLQKLNGAIADVRLNVMPYDAAAFVEDLRGKVQSQFPKEAEAVQWKDDVGAGQMCIDPQIAQQAFLELFANAFRHSRAREPILAQAKSCGENFVFTLHEPKDQFDASAENWGREPFGKVTHGHYGLGLHRVRSIIEAHHGSYEAQYDSAAGLLVTTVALPLLAA